MEDILTEREAKSRLLDDLKFDREQYSSNVKIDNKKLKNIKETPITKTSYAEAQRVRNTIDNGVFWTISTGLGAAAGVAWSKGIISGKTFLASAALGAPILGLVAAGIANNTADKYYDKKFNIGQYQSRNKLLNKHSK